MNNELIEQLLGELYEADDTLRAKESVLRPLLAELLAGKPDAAIDPHVRAQIKAALLLRAALPAPAHSAWTVRMRPYWGLAGAVIIAVLVVPVLLQPKARLAFAPTVKTSAERSFGPLSGTTGASNQLGGRGGGGGMGGAPAIDIAASKARPQSGGGYADAAYNVSIPRFTYEGDITLESGTVQVLRRVKGNLSQGALSRLVGSFDLGSMMNLKSFPGMGLASVTLTQDREYGYAIGIDFAEGSVGVMQNWLRWPNPYAQCTEQACYESLRIKESQLLSDADAIAIAGAFLAEHDISLAEYGAPELMNDWAIAYTRASAQDRAVWYFPEQISVVYPLIVDGLTVYEEGGAKAGVQVNIDVRTRRVVGVNGLTTRTYESSAYAAQTDTDKFRRALARGSWRDYGAPESNADSVAVPVGEPSRAWMRTWISDASGMGSEILVPALVFPIGKGPANVSLWQTNIVLPLAAELYNPLPDGQPIPLSAPAAAEPGI